MSEQPITIFCSVDENYLMPLAVMLKSLEFNYKGTGKINVIIIIDDLEEAGQKKLRNSLNSEVISIIFIQIDHRPFQGFRVDKHVSVATYYRLLIPELVPPAVDKVIYLDSDTVVRTDIQQLWNIPFDNSSVLAVVNGYVRGSSLERCTNLPPHSKYFNAGVLVIDVKRWRHENVSERVLAFIVDKNPEMWDQDGLNAILHDEWKEIDPRWNVLNHLVMTSNPKMNKTYRMCAQDHPKALSRYPIQNTEEMTRLFHDPYIIHYTSRYKPWIRNLDVSFRSEFFRYLELTSWSNWSPSLFDRTYLLLGLRPVIKKYMWFKHKLTSILKNN